MEVWCLVGVNHAAVSSVYLSWIMLAAVLQSKGECWRSVVGSALGMSTGGLGKELQHMGVVSLCVFFFPRLILHCHNMIVSVGNYTSTTWLLLILSCFTFSTKLKKWQQS